MIGVDRCGICPWCKEKVEYTGGLTLLNRRLLRHCGKAFYFNSYGLLEDVLDELDGKKFDEEVSKQSKIDDAFKRLKESEVSCE